MIGFFRIFLQMYQRCVEVESTHPRPEDVEQGNWLECILAKRKAKWMMPLSVQIAKSRQAVEKAKG